MEFPDQLFDLLWQLLAVQAGLSALVSYQSTEGWAWPQWCGVAWQTVCRPLILLESRVISKHFLTANDSEWNVAPDTKLLKKNPKINTTVPHSFLTISMHYFCVDLKILMLILSQYSLIHSFDDINGIPRTLLSNTIIMQAIYYLILRIF